MNVESYPVSLFTSTNTDAADAFGALTSNATLNPTKPRAVTQPIHSLVLSDIHNSNVGDLQPKISNVGIPLSPNRFTNQQIQATATYARKSCHRVSTAKLGLHRLTKARRAVATMEQQAAWVKIHPK
jgi:hypothetical protein